MKSTKALLEKYNIVPDISKDQYFLVDLKVARRVVEIAGVGRSDRVLEVGPGTGILTYELAKKAKEVIAIEIDKAFKPILNKMPGNVQVIYGNAYKLLNDSKFCSRTKPPTKVVSNIPYSRAQNMLHNYTNGTWYRGGLTWVAPMSLCDKINNEPILGAYFNAEVVEEIPKSAFYPQPNTTSAIINFKRISDPMITGNFEIYFRRWLYNHEGWKVKNAIREGIIKAAYDLKKVKVTKNEARKLMSDLDISNEEMEKLTNNIHPDYYFEIPRRLGNWFKRVGKID